MPDYAALAWTVAVTPRQGWSHVLQSGAGFHPASRFRTGFFEPLQNATKPVRNRLAGWKPAPPLPMTVLVLALCAATGPALGQITVTINTSALNGKPGKLVFDYTTSSPSTVSSLAGPFVEIINFTAAGATIGLPSSIGGLIYGDMILQHNPAAATYMTTDYFGQGAFFTELSENITQFSNSITFQLGFGGAQAVAGEPPDQFAFYVLDSNGNAWFSTADPLGANALFTVDVTGNGTGNLNVYAPAVEGANNAITVVLPPNGSSLALNRNALNFGVTPNKATITSAQNVLVEAPTGVAWTASSNQPYVSVSPASGTGPGIITVGVVAAALPATSPAAATITVSAPSAANSPQTVIVNVAYSATSVPFGSFDTPADGSTGITGAIGVTGWALDNIEIASVDVWREPVTGEATPAGGLVFIGNAVLVADARPDVQAAYPTFPYSYRGGWGYQVLTNELPNSNGVAGLGNGTYKLHALAHNTVGATVDLGTHTITVNNAAATIPFGTIDTPAQGGTAAGTAFVNFGWALTQNPYVIPTNGSTITVQVDGLGVGNPVYNQYRSDIATLFPGLANSNGAVGYYMLNTTTLANGVHTIAWVVYDNQNRGAGIGSRYFDVVNTGGSPAASEPVIEYRGPVMLRRGYDSERPAWLSPRQENGWFIVDVEEMERIELRVGAGSGSLVANAERGALPAGSTLRGGVFYWQLGAGFLGEFPIVFERADGSLVPVMVKVRAKTYNSQ